MKDVIKNRIWRVFLISILTGLIISIVEFASFSFMAKGGAEWTVTMRNTVFWIDIILAVVLFFITGLFCFRDMGKGDIAKSATIVALYYIIIVALEQLSFSMMQYSFVPTRLYIPTKLYSVIHQALLKFTSISAWIFLFPSIIAPYLYIMFGKRKLH